MDTRLTSMAIRTAPRADRLSFFTSRPPRKMPRQAQGMAVMPAQEQTEVLLQHHSDTAQHCSAVSSAAAQLGDSLGIASEQRGDSAAARLSVVNINSVKRD